VSASAAGSVVLSIGKLGASRKQLAYYEEQVAAGIEDYYAGRGEAPGRWRGRGLRELGVAAGGRVERGAFMALMRGRDPVSGVELRRMGACSTVAALDLTFSAPKSVSVLMATGDDELGSALVVAHERAVDEALGYLEREACFTRRGHAGAIRVAGEGFVAASYRHRLSRAGDPQLHTHVVVANLTLAERRYTALDAHVIYEHKNAAGAVYRAALRAQVRERVRWAAWRPADRGLFEIDSVPEVVLRHFSQRRVEIEARADELVGADAGGLSRERMQGIALHTRRAKEHDIDGAGWREQARARAAEHGFGRAELATLEARAPSVDRVDLDAVFVRLSSEEGLTESHNTFARRHALAEIAGALPDGMAAAELEAVTDRYLADPQVVALGGDGDPRYTTVGLLACEQRMIDGAERRARERTAVLTPFFVDRVAGQHEPSLNEEQATVVRAIVCSGRGVEAVQALAGTGKTTMLAALADCYREARYRVIGAAPTARAARQLRETAGIPATTMHSLLNEVDQAGGFAGRTVLLIDEAGMAETRLTAALLAHAERAGAKVIAVGDPGQLQSVQAGGWLAALAEQQPELALREVIRQQDPVERAALEALHDGEPERYLAHKQSDISVHADEHAAAEALLDRWLFARAVYGAAAVAMIVRDNRTRELLNHLARQRLKAQHQLPPVGVRISGREYVVGDRVIARRNDRHQKVDNGTLGTVVGIDADHVHVRTDSGESRALELPYVAEHLEHAYALTAHGAQGATVTWAGVLGRPEEFTREWAYTALSRAREKTVLHLVADRPSDARDADAYDPLTARRGRDESLQALHHAMRRTQGEPLAAQQLAQAPPLGHRLAGDAYLARQRELDRLALADLQRELPGMTRLRRVGDERRLRTPPELGIRLHS
jgi:conjugative relaxase-like TrwC/TraI family protein